MMMMMMMMMTRKIGLSLINLTINQNNSKLIRGKAGFLATVQCYI